MLSKRNALKKDEILTLSRDAQMHVTKIERFRSAQSVGLYWAFGTEVRTDYLLEQAQLIGKKVSFPAVRGDKLSFYEYSASGTLVKGRFGIMEPLPLGKPTHPDLLVVPGVAFDGNGFRLGYGKGYYDRYLSTAPTFSIGLAYSFQVTDRIPRSGHDKVMNAIVTENGLVNLNG